MAHLTLRDSPLFSANCFLTQQTLKQFPIAGRRARQDKLKMWWQTVEVVLMLTTQKNKIPIAASGDQPFLLCLWEHGGVFCCIH